MPGPQIQFRAVGPLTDELESRSEVGKPASEVARRDLGRYYVLLARSLPQFTLEEAMLLVNALNGHLTMPETAHLLWAEVEGFVVSQLGDEDSYPNKWDSLILRLKKLTPFEQLAVADAVERAWNASAYHLSDMSERLLAVGLVRKEGGAS